MSSPEVGDEHASARSDIGRQSPDRGADRRDEESTDAVEEALAAALTAAATAGRFDVVAQLARELEARRLARSGNVIELSSRRSQP